MIDRRALVCTALALPFIGGMARAGEGFGPIAVGFAPPLDSALRAITQTEFAVGGRTANLIVTRRYIFGRGGDGYRLTSRIEAMVDDAPPRLSAMVQASIAPLVGLNLNFDLDGRGHIVAVDSDGSGWRTIEAALSRMIAANPAGSPQTPILRQMAALSPAHHHEMMVNEVRDLIRFAGRSDLNATRAADDMIDVAENDAAPWHITARVHRISGLCWSMEKARADEIRPPHGIIASRMALSIEA